MLYGNKNCAAHCVNWSAKLGCHESCTAVSGMLCYAGWFVLSELYKGKPMLSRKNSKRYKREKS